MSRADRQLHDAGYIAGRQPWMLAAYTSLGLALVTVLAIAGWGASVDFEESRLTLLQEKVNGLRSHGVRSVLRVHELTNTEGATAGLDSPAVAKWLHEQWDRSIKNDPSRLYAALVDNDGRVLVHYHRDLEGGRLDLAESHPTTPQAGDDVFETSDPKLTGGDKALDIQIPITQGDRKVGIYHSGFNLQWFEQELAEKRRETSTRWGIAFLVISLVVLLAGFSLFQIAKRLSNLQGAVTLGHVRRLADLGQLAGGIAHEIRNPLNAIRLNLHVIQKRSEARHEADKDDVEVIEETVREIERVDGLLKTMLDYARPEQARQETIDVTSELQSVIKFLAPLLKRDRIDLSLDIDHDTLRTKMDRGRFRQVSLNLLKNAMEAVRPEGRVAVALHRTGGSISLVVSDTGVGLPPEGADHIFEPFYSTKELGTGLGLTLVKRYVEEADGSITARAAQPRGAIFEVHLPCVESAQLNAPIKPTLEAAVLGY